MRAWARDVALGSLRMPAPSRTQHIAQSTHPLLERQAGALLASVGLRLRSKGVVSLPANSG
ncbi:hypothetical protein BER93_02325 [Xanthomonas fragariae]|nr:hypothetical protein BER92_02325 [Xanthomonas fragariae]AOD17172.1 hypothetical protein BER93_02325 [Xanthomonas fragariae]